MDKLVRVQLKDVPVQKATFMQLRKVCGVEWGKFGPAVVGVASTPVFEETCTFTIVRVNEEFDLRTAGGQLGLFQSPTSGSSCMFGSCFA